MIIHDERNEATNDTTHVKDTPKQRDIGSFTGSSWIRSHDCALSSPEKACADAKHCTSNNGKGLIVVVVIVQERACIENIGGAASSKGPSGSKDVINASTKDSKYGKGGVESGVGVVSGCWIKLPPASHAREGVEHAWAAEAY